MKLPTILAFLLSFAINTYSQIGYQVSLLDQDTGAPRAYELITAIIELTDNDGNVICSETKSATSNEFGVISLTVGDENTFDKMDWSKLPLWISATVDGVIIGKSQVLTVPVAEYAHKTGILTLDKLCSKTWQCTTYYENGGDILLNFSNDGKATYFNSVKQTTTNYNFEIDGNTVILYSMEHNVDMIVAHYLSKQDIFVIIDYDLKLFQ